MKIFTIKSNNKNRLFLNLFILAFWVLIWHFISIAVSSAILLPSPTVVLTALLEKIFVKHFWGTVLNSLAKIMLGLIIATASGILLAVASNASGTFYLFISPLISVIKAVPVASFTIIALVWVKSAYLSILASFLMVLPIVYFSIYEGVKSVDKLLLEMAQVFKVKKYSLIVKIYVPQIMPHFISAVSVSFGLAWKSGVAAEVIGLPNNSIGINLYNAKVYLETADLFAWTIVIVLLSVAMEFFLAKVLKVYNLKR